MRDRLPDWRQRFDAYLARVERRRFAYGSHDCALFAAGAVEAMTGDRLADGYAYASQEEGEALLPPGGLEELASEHLTAVPRLMAMIGDVALVDGEGGPSLGVVVGAHVAVLRRDGLGAVPLDAARMVFRP
jgi:hypothetical protein